MMIKKITALLLALILTAALLSAGAEALPEADAADSVAEASAVTMDTLLDDLLAAYRARQAIDADLETLDDETARAVAEIWEDVYLRQTDRLYLFGQDDPAQLPIRGAHAIVVLGYELQDGEMADELKGRCDAAAALANAFPQSLLVCSGGATGSNNPEGHTEAGLMKDYLVSVCGIAAERILMDERAMTTADNAVNTMAMLRERNITAMTLVTSAYHQRWAQVLYRVVAYLTASSGDDRVESIANFCLDLEPSNPAYLDGARIAVRQLKKILEDLSH